MEQVEQVDATAAEAPGPAGVTRSVWRTIRNYILWSYPRGSVHYDIMVTLILLFIFVTPYFCNFKDKPVEHVPHPTGVLVLPDGHNGFVYEVPASAISGKSDTEIREQLQQIIEPIAGEISVSKYQRTRDSSGNAVYRVSVEKL